MKRLMNIFMVSMVIMILFSVTAYADMAPKPKIIVNVENAPKEYYLDILAPYISDIGYKYNSDMIEKYGEKVVEKMFSLTDEGWYPRVCDDHSMTWGDLTADKNGQHVFRYNPPEKFRVIILSADGEIKVSDTIVRNNFQREITIDYNTMEYFKRPVWQVFPMQFVSSFIPTVIIELFILLLFRFSISNNLAVFLGANFVTQLVLNFIITYMFIKEGPGAFLFGWLIIIIIEGFITYTEALVYRKYLKGHNEALRFQYGIVANITSASVSLLGIGGIINNLAEFAGFVI